MKKRTRFVINLTIGINFYKQIKKYMYKERKT